MVDMLTIIAYEAGVKSSLVSSVISDWKSGNASATGAPQQLVTGLYSCVKMIYLIASANDTYGTRASYLSGVLDSLSSVNRSCTGAPQQAANGMYRIVEMLAGWAVQL